MFGSSLGNCQLIHKERRAATKCVKYINMTRKENDRQNLDFTIHDKSFETYRNKNICDVIRKG